MSQKAEQLAALLNSMRDETENFYAALPQAEREANGTWEAWTPKDVVAHLNFWQKSLLDILKSLEQTPSDAEPFEERNRKNYFNNASRPWAEVNAEFENSQNQVMALVKTFSDAELTEPNHFPRITNGTLQGTILGNTYSHAATHLSELIGKRYGAARGQQFQEHATQKLIEFDPSPHAKGVALYNLACSFALSGNSQRAIELLRQVVPLRPDLIEFSKQDTDLVSLRELPEYQALYN